MLRITAAALLVVGALAPARAAEVDRLLPAEVEAVTVYNVRQIVDSALFKAHAAGPAKKLLAQEEVQTRLKDAGVEPLKDIDSVTMGTWLTAGETEPKMVLIARGTFDPAKLFTAAKAAARDHGNVVSIVTHGGYQMVQIAPPAPTTPFVVASPDEKTLLASNDKGALAKLIGAAVAPPAKAAINKDLAFLVLAQDAKAAMYSANLITPANAAMMAGLNNVQIPGIDLSKLTAQVGKIKTYSWSVRLAADVGAELSVGLPDAGAAADFGEAADDAIAALKQFLPLAAKAQPKMAGLADEFGKTARVKTDGKAVTVSLKLSADAIGQAVPAGGDGD